MILTGSLARDEASFFHEASGLWRAFGDAEFLLVIREKTPLPSRVALQEIAHRVGKSLEGRGVLCPIGISAAHPGYLRAIPPSIYAYELRHCGRVVLGEARILDLVPDFRAAEIPLEDAWRLLANRMVETVAAASGLSRMRSPRALDGPAQYSLAKLILDMATSLLVFENAYAPSYRERMSQLDRLAQHAGRADGERLPFALEPFAQLVSTVTQWKLSPAVVEQEQSCALAETALRYGRCLWNWELARLIGADPSVGHSELMRRWMSSQRASERLRGWASVARRAGGLRCSRQWLRWLRLGWRASPRYWVYAAAAELFIALSCVRDGKGRPFLSFDRISREELRRWLPLQGRERGSVLPNSESLATEIAWNYETFLVETRA